MQKKTQESITNLLSPSSPIKEWVHNQSYYYKSGFIFLTTYESNFFSNIDVTLLVYLFYKFFPVWERKDPAMTKL